jgi:hypothetical protein
MSIMIMNLNSTGNRTSVLLKSRVCITSNGLYGSPFTTLGPDGVEYYEYNTMDLVKFPWLSGCTFHEIMRGTHENNEDDGPLEWGRVCLDFEQNAVQIHAHMPPMSTIFFYRTESTLLSTLQARIRYRNQLYRAHIAEKMELMWTVRYALHNKVARSDKAGECKIRIPSKDHMQMIWTWIRNAVKEEYPIGRKRALMTIATPPL